jgi:uncharacterized protein
MPLVNARTGDVVATDVELADTRAARRKGLLGRDHLDSSAALVLSPCFMVHTIGMRFPIDVVFVDRAGVVVKMARHLGPGTMAMSLHARIVIELAGGRLKACEIRVGDRLCLHPQVQDARGALRATELVPDRG